VAQVEITSELDHAGGWVFDTQTLDADGVLHRHRLTLSWADYNHWSGSGADAPARVAEAVMEFVLSRRPPEEVPPSFNAASVRRWFADADALIPAMIRG
jgi:hypothetical protein